MKFAKMHGAGNDFVVLGAEAVSGRDLSVLAKRMCDRNFGVGADGLIAVLPSDTAHFQMRIFNPDGTEPEMCGNGVRCAVQFFIDENLGGKIPGEEIAVDTLAGIRRIRVSGEGASRSYTVDMGEPILEPERIPVLAEGERFVSRPVQAGGRAYAITSVSMGNPHAVIFVKDDAALDDVLTHGPIIEKLNIFPAKTNVEFARVIADNEIIMRVWERGAGITLACGTGACATLVAANLNSLCGRSATLHLPGGDLFIEWTQAGSVEMTGPAETVFVAEWLLD